MGTVQGRLPQELKLEGMADMSSANRYSGRIVLAADGPALRGRGAGADTSICYRQAVLAALATVALLAYVLRARGAKGDGAWRLWTA